MKTFGYEQGADVLEVIGEHDETVTRIASVAARSGMNVVDALPPPARGTRTNSEDLTRRLSTYLRLKRRENDVRRKHYLLVNCTRRDGTTEPSEVARYIAQLRANLAQASIIVLLDESNEAAVEAAKKAGATTYVGVHEKLNWATLSWRLSDALKTDPHGNVAGESSSDPELSPDEIDRRIAEALEALPAPGESRRRLVENWIGLTAPTLRSKISGRLDANLIRDRLGVSQKQLATALGVLQQTISANPDGVRLEAGLAPIARVLVTLDGLMEPKHQRMWLNAPRSDLRDRTPLQCILDGDAAMVAELLEGTLGGSLE